MLAGGCSRAHLGVVQAHGVRADHVQTWPGRGPAPRPGAAQLARRGKGTHKADLGWSWGLGTAQARRTRGPFLAQPSNPPSTAISWLFEAAGTLGAATKVSVGTPLRPGSGAPRSRVSRSRVPHTSTQVALWLQGLVGCDGPSATPHAPGHSGHASRAHHTRQVDPKTWRALAHSIPKWGTWLDTRSAMVHFHLNSPTVSLPPPLGPPV